jgi:membrane protein YdbS with pleckstrin-like domain
MLNENEKRFLAYWEAQRETEKKLMRQLLIGIPIGLIFAIPILIMLFSGKIWYKRADAVANTQLNPLVLIIAIIVIAAFVAIFYKRHQWDMREQHYKELKEREKNL